MLKLSSAISCFQAIQVQPRARSKHTAAQVCGCTYCKVHGNNSSSGRLNHQQPTTAGRLPLHQALDKTPVADERVVMLKKQAEASNQVCRQPAYSLLLVLPACSSVAYSQLAERKARLL